YTIDANSGDTLYKKLPAFSFINQDGIQFHSDSLKGKVWLASFYSTNNKYIGKITRRLLWPNFKYRNEEDIYQVSFSMDTEYDTPEVLKTYIDDATKYNQFEGKWQFLTGDQEKIHELIRSGFEHQDLENTSVVFLVDTEGYVRGRYEGNREDEIKDAIEDIALLKKEIDKKEYDRRKAAEQN
ncbi:MAG: SCO family protein, partial [Flavobacteriales bacterium]|nr:SCO family protein [Flavobacteriales bacterium]